MDNVLTQTALPYGGGMKRPAAMTAVALVIAALSACSAQPGGTAGTQSVEPTRSSNSSLAGIERKARSTWDAYIAASSRALGDPSIDVQSLQPYVTREQLGVVSAQLKEFRSSGKHLDGALRTRKYLAVDPPTGFVAQALVCVDNTHSRILDASGKDVGSKSRADYYALKVSFAAVDNKVLLAKDAMWDDSSIC